MLIVVLKCRLRIQSYLNRKKCRRFHKEVTPRLSTSTYTKTIIWLKSVLFGSLRTNSIKLQNSFTKVVGARNSFLRHSILLTWLRVWLKKNWASVSAITPCKFPTTILVSESNQCSKRWHKYKTRNVNSTLTQKAYAILLEIISENMNDKALWTDL